MKRVLFLLAFICMGIGMATAQTTKVTGRIFSESDGEPVIGASVLVIGTNLGASTDIEGNFTIENVPASATTLRVSYVGLATQEVQIVRGKAMKIIMTEDAAVLDDVMVVAYGTAKKSAFTGSASVIKAEKIEQRQVSNVTNALSGTIAGVQTLCAERNTDDHIYRILCLIGIGMILTVPIVSSVEIGYISSVRLNTLALGVKPDLPRANAVVSVVIQYKPSFPMCPWDHFSAGIDQKIIFNAFSKSLSSLTKLDLHISL